MGRLRLRLRLGESRAGHGKHDSEVEFHKVNLR
jgi:hypothetical protein